jgi:hypothetical protein
MFSKSWNADVLFLLLTRKLLNKGFLVAK